MNRRFLNRLAQRYLVRPGSTPLSIGPPTADPDGSTAWHIGKATEANTFHISVSGDSRSRLYLNHDGSVTVGRVPDSTPQSGRWRFVSAQDESDYRFVVSHSDPNLFLSAGTVKTQSGFWPVVLSAEPDRASMWMLQEACVADARSAHLRYHTRSDVSLFYNEVYPEQAPPGTYLCTSGFGANARSFKPSGYAGIQTRRDGSRRAIFSVWHRMADEERTVQGSLATPVAVHPDALVTMFGGEGSGSSIRLPLDWSRATDQKVRVCIASESMGGDTVVSCYFAVGDEPWISLGAIVRAGTRGAQMSSLYAFVEDFQRSGNAAGVDPGDRSPYQIHSARFANPWCAGVGSPLQPIKRVTLTAYGPHPLENINAEIADRDRFGVRVVTGGSAAGQAPPIGSSFADDQHDRRPRPNLSGVPHL